MLHLRVESAASSFCYQLEFDEIKKFDDDALLLVYGICALYTYSIISKTEYVRSIGAIFAWCGKDNMPRNNLGELEFKEEVDKVGAAIGLQFFHENIPEIDVVFGMWEKLHEKLPEDALKKVADAAADFKPMQ